METGQLHLNQVELTLEVEPPRFSLSAMVLSRGLDYFIVIKTTVSLATTGAGGGGCV